MTGTLTDSAGIIGIRGARKSASVASSGNRAVPNLPSQSVATIALSVRDCATRPIEVFDASPSDSPDRETRPSAREGFLRAPHSSSAPIGLRQVDLPIGLFDARCFGL